MKKYYDEFYELERDFLTIKLKDSKKSTIIEALKKEYNESNGALNVLGNFKLYKIKKDGIFKDAKFIKNITINKI